jgi:hypothetical protein
VLPLPIGERRKAEPPHRARPRSRGGALPTPGTRRRWREALAEPRESTRQARTPGQVSFRQGNRLIRYSQSQAVRRRAGQNRERLRKRGGGIGDEQGYGVVGPGAALIPG